MITNNPNTDEDIEDIEGITIDPELTDTQTNNDSNPEDIESGVKHISTLALQPSRLFTLIRTMLPKEWNGLNEVITSDTNETEYYSSPGSDILIYPPSVDIESKAGCKNLNETLKKIEERNLPWKTAFVSICQSNKYFFGLITRAHFTLLKLSKDDQGNISAHHYDSKGWLSRLFYSLNPIKESLQKNFKDKYKNFSSSYFGHQNITDNINCGRFVAHYITQFINNENIGATHPFKDPKKLKDCNIKIFHMLQELDKSESATFQVKNGKFIPARKNHSVSSEITKKQQ